MYEQSHKPGPNTNGHPRDRPATRMKFGLSDTLSSGRTAIQNAASLFDNPLREARHPPLPRVTVVGMLQEGCHREALQDGQRGGRPGVVVRLDGCVPRALSALSSLDAVNLSPSGGRAFFRP